MFTPPPPIITILALSVLQVWALILNPIVSLPSEAFGHGYRTARCLSARMCEFVPPPWTNALRGHPDFSRDAKRRGGFLGGTLSLPPKKGCKKMFMSGFASLHPPLRPCASYRFAFQFIPPAEALSRGGVLVFLSITVRGLCMLSTPSQHP